MSESGRQRPDRERRGRPSGRPLRLREGGPAHLRTILLEDRGIGVRVYDWVTKQGVAGLDEIEAVLAPPRETVHAQVVEPAVLVFEEPMPLPSGADFGGLIAR